MVLEWLSAHVRSIHSVSFSLSSIDVEEGLLLLFPCVNGRPNPSKITLEPGNVIRPVRLMLILESGK